MRLLLIAGSLLTIMNLFYQCQSRNDALKEMNSLAIAPFFLPGEARFPLNNIFNKPADRTQEGILNIIVFQLQCLIIYRFD